MLPEGIYIYIRVTLGFASWRVLLRRCITTSAMTGGRFFSSLSSLFAGGTARYIFEHNPEKWVRNMILLLKTDIAIYLRVP
jgi:hypothetical protein